MHELRLIERARMKRKWEQALPPITGPESLNKRRMIVEAIERDEWAFREQVLKKFSFKIRYFRLSELMCGV